MKTVRFIILALSSIVVITSCNRLPAGTPDSQEYTFVTGEALVDNTLIPTIYPDALVGYRVETTYDGKTNKSVAEGLTISFQLNLDKEYHRITRWKGGWIPSEAVFNSFGSEAKQVKNEFNAVYETLLQPSPAARTVTIYHKDIKITSNAEVCGVAPGENLYPSIFSLRSYDKGYQLPEETIPEGYAPLSTYAAFTVWAKDNNREVVDGNPTFYIEIPVKIGMYLTYLKEKRTNPAAQLQYRDDVLTCTLSTGKNVR